MSIKDKRLAILVDNYFEQPEFELPLNYFKQAGVDVSVVAASTNELQGMWHTLPGDLFQATVMLENADSEDYDALILPGGVINADSLRMVPKAREWVVDFVSQNKLVAAICHAPWLLVSADVVEGRRLTSYTTLQDDIRNAGGEWVDNKVVVDRNIITSRTPDDLDDFIKAIEAWFNLASTQPQQQ